MSNEKKYIPKQVVWELTLQCNLHCIHCGSSAGKKRMNELNTKESLKLCNDLAKINTEEVCFMGGEPFLRKEWERLGREVKDLGMKLLIISNGYCVNNAIISKLVKLQPYAVSTSLDGATAKTHDYIRGAQGSFKKVLEFISLSKKSNLPVTVITTVSKLNFKELPMMKDYLLKKNIAWQIQTAAPEGRFAKNLALSKEEFYTLGLFIANLQKTYKPSELPVIGAHCFGYHSNHIPSLGLSKQWMGCQAGISIMSIKSNGDIIGCLSTPEQYIEGNIRSRSIIDIWNDPNAFGYNRNFTIDNLGESCKECKYGATCKGGCMGMSTAFTQKPHNDTYCFYKIESESFDEK